ncbi:hypothetical protein OH799_11130 [Nocardia sp. NBC_00881]|uniref:hypothetical protein n=1 Tax=Nocardia sp. NBC_00881 TaxID=2975995 RepID=UPI003867575C|nr:hypothetical protein OH799_11130 [Nocardia sp. NBC_00881]
MRSTSTTSRAPQSGPDCRHVLPPGIGHPQLQDAEIYIEATEYENVGIQIRHSIHGNWFPFTRAKESWASAPGHSHDPVAAYEAWVISALARRGLRSVAADPTHQQAIGKGLIDAEAHEYLSTAGHGRCWIPSRAFVAGTGTSTTDAPLQRNGFGGVSGMDIDLTCPHCNQLDLVQSVPALHADGVSTSSETNVYSGVGVASTGLVPVFGTATVERYHTTALARSLAREPARTPAGRLTFFALVLLLPAMCWIVPAIVSIADPAPGVSRWVAALSVVVFFGMLAAPGAVLLTVAVCRIRGNGRVARGRRNAHEVWQAGFYCHRCGLAFWPVPPAPGVPARQAFTPQHFRSFVWNAGGYANI